VAQENSFLPISPEELDSMTFQVGLVAHDGLVIASDRKVTIFQPHLRKPGSRYTTQGRKICTSEDHSIICAVAGDELADAVARRIIRLKIENLRIEALNELLKTTADEASAGHTKGMAEGHESLRVRESSVLVGIPDAKECPLWRIAVRDSSAPHYGAKLFGGDEASSAIYVAEAFYQEYSTSVDRAVAIAAHTVLEAGRLNPSGVSGLDVFVCSELGKRFLSQKEIEGLKDWSEKVHDGTRSLVTATPFRLS